ncbi:MAG: hypothetical protein R3F43_28335 [bacterium]
MKTFLPLLLLLAVLASPAGAQPLPEARAAHAAALARSAAAEAEQARLRAAHESLVGRIGTLKAADRQVLPGVGDGRLDALLKEAHEVATRLEELDRRVEDAEAATAAARGRLVAALDAALAAENAALAGGSADARQAFERMKSLVTERSALAAAGQAGSRAVVKLPPVGEVASADELRELADEASDNAERVRSQLKALEDRLQALQTRRRMLRAAMAFDRDAALFAEDERNRRLVRSDQPSAGVASAREPTPPTRDTGTAGGRGAEGSLAGDDEANAAPPPGQAPEAGAGAGAEFDGDADGLIDNADPSRRRRPRRSARSRGSARGRGHGRRGAHRRDRPRSGAPLR